MFLKLATTYFLLKIKAQEILFYLLFIIKICSQIIFCNIAIKQNLWLTYKMEFEFIKWWLFNPFCSDCHCDMWTPRFVKHNIGHLIIIRLYTVTLLFIVTLFVFKYFLIIWVFRIMISLPLWPTPTLKVEDEK